MPVQPGAPGEVPAVPAGDGPPASATASGALAIQIGALAGVAAPFNRRRDQVATLGGASLSVGVGRQLGVWLDLDSFGNRDASHGTVLVSGSVVVQVGRQLWIGARLGLGATLVNFDDPAFRDVVGSTARFETLIDLRFGSWALWFRPLAVDVLTAADLGGPIATWQTRIGVAYRIPIGGRRAAAPSQGVAAASQSAAAPHVGSR